MSNLAPLNLIKGRIGELLVELTLLAYKIESTKPPIDSGNDLITTANGIFKTIQIKTEAHDKKSWKLPKESTRYNLLILVKLGSNWNKFDTAKIYLLKREEAGKHYRTESPISPKIRRMLYEDDNYSLSNRLDLFYD